MSGLSHPQFLFSASSQILRIIFTLNTDPLLYTAANDNEDIDAYFLQLGLDPRA